MSHLTYNEALTQARAYGTQSLAALPSGASLKTDLENAVPCSDSDGAGADSPVNIGISYNVLGVSGSDLRQVVDRFADYWSGQGWRKVSDSRPKDEFVVFESAGQYAVGIQLDVAATRATVSVSAPCTPPRAPSPSSGGDG